MTPFTPEDLAYVKEHREYAKHGALNAFLVDRLILTVESLWAVTCPKCGRPWQEWPLRRANTCAPKSWMHCIRPMTDR